MALDVGSAVSGADARGPHCERMRALSSRAGHTESWMNFTSNFLEALCCHPIFGWLGSGSSSRLVSANSSHGGTCQSCVHQHPLALVDGNKTRDRVVSLQLSDHQPCGPRVPLFDHSEGICQTCPMCSGSNTNCADQSQTAR